MRKTSMKQTTRMWLGLFVVLIILSRLAPFAVADEEDDAPAEAAQVNQGFFVQEENFDQWVFQGSGNAAAGRTRIKSSLQVKLAELQRVCNLTDAQSRKLSLAAQGDLKRFFDEVEVVRQKFLKVRNDQNAFNNIWQEIHPLQQQQQAGLFGDTSLFGKTIRKTLTEEQRAKYQSVLEDRRRFRYRAAIDVSLHTLTNTVALRNEQHEAVFKLLAEDTQPPQIFGQYDQYFVFYSLAKLPNAKLKPLFDDRQWKLLQQHLQQGRGMESTLIQQGMIDPPKGRILKSVRTLLLEADGHSEAPAAAKADAAQ